MQIELTKRFLAAVKKRSAAEVAAVEAALARLPDTFGRPHLHTGVSVRPIRPPVYEVRASRALRIIVVRRAQSLTIDFVGSHDEIAAFLRNSC